MLYIIIGITGLLTIVALFAFIIKSKHRPPDKPEITDMDCCGLHAVCEKGVKLADPHIDYFEDEELDAFRQIDAKLYDDKQIELFRDVLYTLRKEEIEEWLISLEKREINLPEILKPEVMDMIANAKKR